MFSYQFNLLLHWRENYQFKLFFFFFFLHIYLFWERFLNLSNQFVFIFFVLFSSLLFPGYWFLYFYFLLFASFLFLFSFYFSSCFYFLFCFCSLFYFILFYFFSVISEAVAYLAIVFCKNILFLLIVLIDALSLMWLVAPGFFFLSLLFLLFCLFFLFFFFFALFDVGLIFSILILWLA